MQQGAKRQRAAAASSIADLQEQATFLAASWRRAREQTATSEVLQERGKLSAEL